MIDLINLKTKAEDLFLQKNYKDSMLNYMDILSKFPNDKDAKIGAILNDMAFEKEDEAQAMFDYYLILKKRSPHNAADIIKEVIDNFDSTKDRIAHSIVEATKALEDSAQMANGIAYSDFKELVEKSDNFKSIFESIMFSTKIVIVGKEEFIEFLNQLIDNNFDEMALNYIEGAIEIFKSDSDIRALCDKLSEKKFEN